MNAPVTNVQLRKMLATGRLLVVDKRDDIEDEDATKRVTLDVRLSDSDFIAAYANYRNHLAKAQGRKIKRWTHKSMLEEFIHVQTQGVRAQMAQTFEVVGQLPPVTDDEEANDESMKRYVAKLLSAEKKNR